MTERITELKAISSANGFYVGRECWDEDGRYWATWSRESQYFATAKEAEDFIPEVAAGRGRVDAFSAWHRGSWR